MWITVSVGLIIRYAESSGIFYNLSPARADDIHTCLAHKLPSPGFVVRGAKLANGLSTFRFSPQSASFKNNRIKATSIGAFLVTKFAQINLIMVNYHILEIYRETSLFLELG